MINMTSTVLWKAQHASKTLSNSWASWEQSFRAFQKARKIDDLKIWLQTLTQRYPYIKQNVVCVWECYILHTGDPCNFCFGKILWCFFWNSDQLSKQVHHRIIEWLGLGGTLMIIQFQPYCRGRGHLPVHQVAQSPIQPGLEQPQVWGIHSFSRQLVPASASPLSWVFLISKLNLLLV